MDGATGKRRIGLLFVHGIGEQKQFEHLVASVGELAELMLGAIPDSSVSVIDRTGDWKLAPGVVDPDRRAHMTLTLRTPDKHYEYECNEVWWADLGTRSGMLDSITFWLWGLGQWAAPIYQELDGAQMSKRPGPDGTLESDLVVLPASVAGKFGEEFLARFRLAMAALAAAFIGSTWALAKRVMKLLGAAPSPTLIVRYVGDVRTYEERAKPGDTAISDPGKPRRVGIRRRMVSEMVNLATRPDIDEWWILAHSQGTVLAYNGLTEIGHTLPNYLPETQWKELDDKFKADPNCRVRSKVHAMVPSRPAWLADDEVINRDLLFQKLSGFITYGSPLDKFAALWPRIVGTATDRKNGENPFRKCTWLNIAAPQDPVAGMLCRYPAGLKQSMDGAIPQVKNIALPFRANYGLAHIRYFTGAERWVDNELQRSKKAIVGWLAGGAEPEEVAAQPFWLRLSIVYFPYLLIIAALGLATAALAAVVAGLPDMLSQFGNAPAKAADAGFIDPLIQDIRQLLAETLVICGLVLGVALAVIIGFGLWRWYSESGLNYRFARADARRDEKAKIFENTENWNLVIEMLARQRAAGLVVLLLALPSMAVGLWIDLSRYRNHDGGFYGASISLAIMTLAIVMQALINWTTSRKVKRKAALSRSRR